MTIEEELRCSGKNLNFPEQSQQGPAQTVPMAPGTCFRLKLNPLGPVVSGPVSSHVLDGPCPCAVVLSPSVSDFWLRLLGLELLILFVPTPGYSMILFSNTACWMILNYIVSVPVSGPNSVSWVNSGLVL